MTRLHLGSLAARGMGRSALPAAGLLLLAVMLLPAVRRAAESSMTAHMLLQYSAVLCVGALLASPLAGAGAGAVTGSRTRRLQRWNELGIAGLLGSALTLAILMVPRVLDLALVDARVETLKLLALVLTGAALRLSWPLAGSVVQAFFLGNLLPMMAVVGTLYQDATRRVCNAYLLDDQRLLGTALVWIAVSMAAGWLLRLGWDRRAPVEPPA
jgi:hypothetical protein